MSGHSCHQLGQLPPPGHPPRPSAALAGLPHRAHSPFPRSCAPRSSGAPTPTPGWAVAPPHLGAPPRGLDAELLRKEEIFVLGRFLTVLLIHQGV